MSSPKRRKSRNSSGYGSHSPRSKRSSRYGAKSSAPYAKRRRTKRAPAKGKQRGVGAAAITDFITQAKRAPKPQLHEIKHAFTDFGFMQVLQGNIDALGYVSPTAIQDQAIPHILRGRDVVGLANTGTGKTAAFLLPVLEQLAQKKKNHILIITPTRELATQIDDELRKFSRGMGVYSAVCIGGMPIHVQLRNLKRNPHIIIGTPGRLQDLQKRRAIRFDIFDTIILDEVDRMLDMGFLSSIQAMLAQSATTRQSLFFSATMPPAIAQLVKHFTHDPVEISVSTGKTAHNVEQVLVRVQDKSKKLDQLKELLEQPEFKKVIIFSETKREVERLAQDLYAGGYRADSIHGDKRQRQRERSLKKFRDNHISILVATDVAARGLDIKEVTHVINYSIPQTYDDYIHRIGRTGRGEHKGTALTFV